MTSTTRSTNRADREQLNPEDDEEKEAKEKARCEWDFTLSTVVSSTTTGAVSDTLGVIEFDPSDHLIATGGIARKIRIYSVKSLLPKDNNPGEPLTTLLDHVNACDYYICTPAKLSSLRWKPETSSRVVGSGDYDGVVTEYDLEQRVPVFERDEHGGRRVWSMDYSHWLPIVGASGSDDGTAHLWDTRCNDGECVAVVQPSLAHSAVCSVEFDPCGGAMVAMGCADRKAYVYDVRNLSAPVVVFCGHRKTVTYVRFIEENKMVSSGTDGCLKLWNMEDGSTIRTYNGHVNSRSFVGLSLWRKGGLFGCGSESNEVFVYDKRWGEPIWVQGFGPMARAGCDRGFVSSVCWRQVGGDECTLVAGGSNGVLQVFTCKGKTS